jgi:hypothetical protein
MAHKTASVTRGLTAPQALKQGPPCLNPFGGTCSRTSRPQKAHWLVPPLQLTGGAGGAPKLGTKVDTKASNALMSQVSSCLSMRPASLMWYTVVPV